MNYEKILDHYTDEVNRKLKNYLKATVKDAEKYHPLIGEVYSNVAEFILRKGRRIASCSTLITYEGYAGKIDKQILDVCIAIELYRHSILIHDDLVDLDVQRRAGKTIHKMFRDKFNERFGEGLAIFAGNILFSQALKAFFTTEFPENILLKVADLLIVDYNAVNESQILDLYFEFSKPSLAEWQVMASKRAASLFRATMGIGALLGGAERRDLKLIEKAATHIGLAFDIQDDIIGTFAKVEQVGRSTDNDILLGKKPLHTIYAYQLAKEDALKILQKFRHADNIKIKRIKEVIKNTGALEKAKNVAKKNSMEAFSLIRQTSMSGKAKEFFKGLLLFITESLDWYT